MSRKTRLLAIAAIAVAMILSIVRVFLDFTYEGISPFIPATDIGFAAAWAFCLIVNIILYQRNKNDKN